MSNVSMSKNIAQGAGGAVYATSPLGAYILCQEPGVSPGMVACIHVHTLLSMYVGHVMLVLHVHAYTSTVQADASFDMLFIDTHICTV